MTRFEPDPMTEISKIARELPKFNIKLLGPHLMKSEMDFSIEGDDIRFGLTSIKGIAEKSIEKLTSFKDQYSNKFEVFQGAHAAGIGVGIFSAEEGARQWFHADSLQRYMIWKVGKKKMDEILLVENIDHACHQLL